MRLIFASTLFVYLASPAVALDATDSMRDWNAAKSADKNELFNRLIKSGSERSSNDGVLSCINDTSKMDAHSDLIISEVYKACSEQSVKDNI